MMFTSFNFFVFFFVVLFFTSFVVKEGKGKKVFLLFASYYFYMSWDWRFGFLLFFISITNYYFGHFIFHEKSDRARKVLLGLSLFTSLGGLAYFKYFNFFIESLNNGFEIIGIDVSLDLLNVILPVGISFYTFQSLSYTLDIYRRKESPIDSPLDFVLFVSFFPQLVAGPIVRARFFLPQLRENRKASRKDFDSGLFLIIVGLIKKVAFADVLAVHIVDPAFEDPTAFSSAYLVLALYAYSFQIYMDFSAYTDIARGIARMLGYELPINFDRPYLATSITNFWQRWHISMSSFFRDYLYFGLGGARKGNVYANLMITFIAIGMWHGAGWNFFLYGALHGFFMCLERFKRKRNEANGVESAELGGLRLGLRVFYIFSLVSFARILFRSNDLDQAQVYFWKIFEFSFSVSEVSLLGAVTLFAALLLHFAPRLNKDTIFSLWDKVPAYVQGGCVVLITYFLVALSQGEAPFVYFQF